MVQAIASGAPLPTGSNLLRQTTNPPDKKVETTSSQNHSHAQFPGIKTRDGREVLRSSEQVPAARHADDRRFFGLLPPKQDRYDHMDYRLTKGSVDSRLQENARLAQEQADHKNEIISFSPESIGEDDSFKFSSGQPVTVNAGRFGDPIHMTINNKISADGVAVAYSKGWELGKRRMENAAAIDSDFYLTKNVRFDKPMQDSHLSTAFDVKMGKTEYKVRMHGVFDGHADEGEKVSVWARDQLPHRIQSRLQQFNPVEWNNQDVYNAMKLAFPDVSRSVKFKEGGTTANVSVAFGNDLWVPNVGDSELLILKEEGYIQANEAARVSKVRNRFSKSILARDCFISRDNRIDGRLAVARSLGENYFEGKISSRPKITRFKRPDNEQWHLIHMTDGMTDVASPKQIADFVRGRVGAGAPLDEIAVELVKAAALAGSTDNITVQIVPFPFRTNKTSNSGFVKPTEMQSAASVPNAAPEQAATSNNQTLKADPGRRA